VVVINQPGARNSSNREIFDSLHDHWQRCAKAGDQGAKK
jgi:enoyl-CoA hydratase/carnithine racemase